MTYLPLVYIALFSLLINLHTSSFLTYNFRLILALQGFATGGVVAGC